MHRTSMGWYPLSLLAIGREWIKSCYLHVEGAPYRTHYRDYLALWIG
jgi:hypothetical protein